MLTPVSHLPPPPHGAGQNMSAELIGLGALPRLSWRYGADFTSSISALLACWVLQLLMPVL